jgi:D-amino-acid dehydrogenase
LISQREYESWTQKPGFDFAYERKGLLELFQTDQKAEHAQHTVDQARALGLDAVLLSKQEVELMEPQTKINALGAIYFRGDAHLYPNRLMQSLLAQLRRLGVRLMAGQKVLGFASQAGRITQVNTQDNHYGLDELVLATGSWSRSLASLLKTSIPMVPGRGYSITLEDSPYRLNHPAVLVEGRVALTPMDGNKIRFGGTMEITSTQTPPRLSRVRGILDAVQRFFPQFDVPMPTLDQVWYGFRPCSADGLPYIGRIRAYPNVVIATGHAMLGLSLGAGTGKLVDEVVCGRPASMNLAPFAVERFG